MQLTANIIVHTPLWVWLVLALLIITGIQALRPRVLPIWRLFIVPAVFIGWGLLGVAQRSASGPMLAVDWIVAVVAGAALGWATTRLIGVTFAADGASVQMPGSPVPLVRNAVVFLLRYGLAVGAIFAIDATMHAQLVLVNIVVSGLTTGYFAGWLARFLIARRTSVARA